MITAKQLNKANDLLTEMNQLADFITQINTFSGYINIMLVKKPANINVKSEMVRNTLVSLLRCRINAISTELGHMGVIIDG